MTENMDLMGNIAKAVVTSSKMQAIDWEEISIICEIDDHGKMNGVYGYAYGSDGVYQAVVPRIRELAEPIEIYRAWLQGDAAQGFKKILFQFNKRSGKVNADFEYDDPSRWQITPSNVEHMIEALRPNLGG